MKRSEKMMDKTDKVDKADKADIADEVDKTDKAVEDSRREFRSVT